MFGPSSYPIQISDETVRLEGEARSFQNSLITRGMRQNGRVKFFKSFILERPRNPYATAATESLAASIERNPLQNHGSWGVIVPEDCLLDVNSAALLFVPLPEGGTALIYAYSDMSCTMALRTDMEGYVRAVTLPFKISSARIMQHDKKSFIKAAVKKPCSFEKKKVLLKKGNEEFQKINLNDELHANFLHDLGIEIESIMTEIQEYAPVYKVEKKSIPEKYRETCEDRFSLYIGNNCTRLFSSEIMSWMMRGNITVHDVHLPFIDTNLETLISIRDFCTEAAKLAKSKSGLQDVKFLAKLDVISENPIQCTETSLLVSRCYQSVFCINAMDPPEKESQRIATNEDATCFLNEFSKIWKEASNDLSCLPKGYQYLYLNGKPGSWSPLFLAHIDIDELDATASDDILESRVKFLKQRMISSEKKHMKS